MNIGCRAKSRFYGFMEFVSSFPKVACKTSLIEQYSWKWEDCTLVIAREFHLFLRAHTENSSTIIEQLVRYSQQAPRTALTYFYFDFNDTGKRDTDSLMRSLITQLSAQCETIPHPLLELYNSQPDGTKVIDEENLLATLRNLILMFHNVYVILDALDESLDCEEILHFVNSVHGWNLSRLHLLVTSRQLADIEEALADLVTERICLQDSEMNEDIILYVADKLENDKSLSRFPPDIRLQIQKKLLEEEDGM
jgi:hypothetical protein